MYLNKNKNKKKLQMRTEGLENEEQWVKCFWWTIFLSSYTIYKYIYIY